LDTTAQLNRVTGKIEKLLDQLVRAHTKRVALTRAVVRSSKRMDKERDLAKVSAPLPEAKPAPLPAKPKDDGLDIPPEFRREPKAKPETLSSFASNKRANEQAPAVERKRKAKRTPDDFKAEMETRKGKKPGNTLDDFGV
jgi:hypothetical protein